MSRAAVPALPQLKDISHLTGAQKAAIFVMYLEEEVVRELFGRLSEDEIRALGEQISHLGRVDGETVQAVVTEFAGSMSRTLHLRTQGDEYLHTVWPSILGPERARRLLRSIEPVTRNDFRKAFGRMEPGSLAARLRREHPQTVAVACAVLGNEAASSVISCFEPELQAEVVVRLARLRKVPMPVLEDIEDLLGGREAERRPVHTMPADGPRLAADAINGLRADVREEVLAIVADRDEALAGEINRRMFSFDLLRSADARGVQNLLKEVERKDLALALKGAAPVVADKFFSNMSTRAADFLRDDMEAMGPVRLADVEAAQEGVMAIALRLEEEGELMFLEGGEVVQ